MSKVRVRNRPRVPGIKWGSPIGDVVVHIDPRYLVGFNGYECGCSVHLPPAFVCAMCGQCEECCTCLVALCEADGPA